VRFSVIVAGSGLPLHVLATPESEPVKDIEVPLKASWCEEPQWLEEAVHELPLHLMVSGKGPVMQLLRGCTR